MECPKCGLLSPDSALRCDCGYDFHTKKLEESYLRGRVKPDGGIMQKSEAAFSSWVIGFLLSAVLFGTLGGIVLNILSATQASPFQKNAVTGMLGLLFLGSIPEMVQRVDRWRKP